jgi:hypothetical protein
MSHKPTAEKIKGTLKRTTENVMEHSQNNRPNNNSLNNRPIKSSTNRRKGLFSCLSCYLVTASLSAAIVGCGANPLQSYEKSEPAEDATVALEQGNPDKAIVILTKALETEPENWVYVSILGLAYAERAGIDALTLAQKMAATSSSSSTNGVTSLFSIMPTATDSHIADVDKAVALMISIPAASRTTADILKIAMFQTSAMTLRTKKYDTNGDGEISVSELLAMSTGDATTMLSQLAAAALAFSSGSSTSTTDVAAAAQITSITTKITACPGTAQEDRLKNYLSKTGC